MSQLNKVRRFYRRKARVRKRIFGTSQRPRLSVARTNSHIYAQIIDDTVGRTLVTASSRDADIRGNPAVGGNVQTAKLVGELLAKRAQTANISAVVFDRGGCLYHGRVKALADASRSHGLNL
ncbi:MAG: 50S ribosomal protein L18 [Nitrospirales bacterium]|nr:50S ribosomal protein L18 [Nitrospirales bacterium]